MPSLAFEALALRTALEEDKAAIAAIVMSEHALEMVKSEKLYSTAARCSTCGTSQRQEQDLAKLAPTQLKAVDEMPATEARTNPARNQENPAAKKELAEMADAAARAAKVSEARLNQKARQ